VVIVFFCEGKSKCTTAAFGYDWMPCVLVLRPSGEALTSLSLTKSVFYQLKVLHPLNQRIFYAWPKSLCMCVRSHTLRTSVRMYKVAGKEICFYRL